MDERIDLSSIMPGWKIVGALGKGSFGTVYRIERNTIGYKEEAALKLIRIPDDDSIIANKRKQESDESIASYFKSCKDVYLKEYVLMRQLNGCENVVSCADYGAVPHKDGLGWDILIRMELLTPLNDILSKEIPEELVARVGIHICKALEYCQQYNILHRDIKPSNIFISKDDKFKLGDFGISKVAVGSSVQSIAGAPPYMAPEVSKGKPYDARADLYSLGIVLYSLLNGNRIPLLPPPPARITRIEEVKAIHRRNDGETISPPPYGSDELKNIILKACAFDPGNRFATATEMRLALENSVKEKDEKQYKVALNYIDKGRKAFSENKIDEANDYWGKAHDIFQNLGDYKDSKQKANECSELLNRTVRVDLKEQYAAALSLMSHGHRAFDQKKYDEAITRYREAEDLFQELDSYCDSVKKKQECNEHIQNIGKEISYQSALLLLDKNDLDSLNEAKEKLSWLGNYRDAEALILKCQAAIENEEKYKIALSLIKQERTAAKRNAYKILKELGHYKNAESISEGLEKQLGAIRKRVIAACLIALLVIATIPITRSIVKRLQRNESGNSLNYGTSQIEDYLRWTDITQIALSSDSIIGLKKNGTVVANGEGNGAPGTSNPVNVFSWNSIQSICAGANHTIGLKKDGTLIATGSNTYGQCDIENWTNIKGVAAGSYHTLGLTEDGSVFATGANDHGQCDVSGWSEIVYVAAGANHTVGLKRDGTVLAVGDNTYGQCDVAYWRDIIDVKCGYFHTVGLRADGTVVSTGENDNGQCDVSSWNHIVGISTYASHTLGLREDGTVVTTGATIGVTSWSDVASVAAGWNVSVGIKNDGTIVATGYTDFGIPILSQWTDVVKVYACPDYSVGLRKDGGVAFSGRANGFSVKTPLQWEDIVALSVNGNLLFGLKENKTMCAADGRYRGYSDWDDLIQVEGNTHAVFGLHSDGTISMSDCTFEDDQKAYQAVLEWEDIISISVASDHIVGLKADGSVLAAGRDHNSGCLNVDTWTNITSIKALDYETLGIWEDGTVVSTNEVYLKQHGWTDIIDLEADDVNFTVFGLKADGTLVHQDMWFLGDYAEYGFTDLIQIAVAPNLLVGLKSDHTVVVAEWSLDSRWDLVKESDLYSASDWTDIVAIDACKGRILGLKADGTVLATGHNENNLYGQCDVGST